MEKNILTKIIFIALIIFLIFPLTCIASFNTGYYNPGTLEKEEAGSLFQIGEMVMGTMQNIAVIVAVITLALIGLRYMFGSLEKKAEYKQLIMPWLVGAIIILTITSILDIIQNLASKI